MYLSLFQRQFLLFVFITYLLRHEQIWNSCNTKAKNYCRAIMMSGASSVLMFLGVPKIGEHVIAGRVFTGLLQKCPIEKKVIFICE